MGMIAAHDPSSATGSHAVSPLLRGINTEVKAVVKLAEVRTVETHGGNIRYVARDTEGKEYTTFREQIEEKRGRCRRRLKVAQASAVNSGRLDVGSPVPVTGRQGGCPGAAGSPPSAFVPVDLPSTFVPGGGCPLGCPVSFSHPLMCVDT
jgi:hypothetical protein